MDQEKKTVICRILYAVTLMAAAIPVACNYVLDGEDVLLWLARVEELKAALSQKQFMLFPSLELVEYYGGQATALNSNLWLLVPASVRLLGGSITLAFRIFMAMIQIGTLFAARGMFERIFEEKTTAALGTFFYMLCPYRIWLCYDQIDLGRCVAWMLIPLLVWGTAGLCRRGVRGKELLGAAFALAGIGCADNIMFLTAAGMTVLAFLWYRKKAVLLPLALGTVCYMPVGRYFFQYLLAGGMDDWNMPLDRIARAGYALGEFFTSYTYRTGHPGLGLGLLGAGIVLAWYYVKDSDFRLNGDYRFWGAAFCLLLCMSGNWFPWDMIQRAGLPFLRLVALIESPNVFFGCACIALCVPAAYAMECLLKEERMFVRVGIPVCVVTMTVGISIYICNTLTYTRLPLYLTDSL